MIKDYGVRKGKLWIHSEIQLEFYYKHMTRFRENCGLFGGIDVDTNRIILAIVDEDGKLGIPILYFLVP